MPTTVPMPKGVHVKVTNGAENEYVKVTNLTSGRSFTEQLNSKKECVVKIVASEGDVVLVQSQGKVLGSEKLIITKGAATATIGESAATSFPSVIL